MALAQLLEYAILRVKACSVPAARISEEESSLVKYGDLIAIFKLSSFVPTQYLIVDECAIAGEILEYSYGVAVSVLVEDDAMAIGNGWDVHDQVAFRMSANDIATGRKADVFLLFLIVFFSFDKFALLLPLRALGTVLSYLQGLDWGRTEGPSLHDKLMACIGGGGKEIAPSAVVVVQIWFDISWRVDEL
jgi:hypothetical protein